VEDFVFNKAVCEVFDDMVRRSVPFYELAQDLMVEAVRRLAPPGAPIYDLGCSTGTTLALLAEALGEHCGKLVGVDSASAMVEEAKRKLRARGYLEVELRTCDIRDVGDYLDEAAGCFVLSLTLQFLRPPERLVLLRTLHNALVEEGVVVVFEKVVEETSRHGRMLIDIHHSFKAAHGYSDLEIAQKREALENVLVPYTVSENVSLLREAGFAEVSLFFKGLNFAAFVASG
jgi:tRNA (cmo5U34)-methyltransferase